MKNNYEKLKDSINKFAEAKIKIRNISYKGKGRPRKTDYTFVKAKDLQDFCAFQILNSGYKTEDLYARK